MTCTHQWKVDRLWNHLVKKKLRDFYCLRWKSKFMALQKKSQANDLKKNIAVIVFGMAKTRVRIKCLAGILIYVRWMVIRQVNVVLPPMSQSVTDGVKCGLGMVKTKLFSLFWCWYRFVEEKYTARMWLQRKENDFCTSTEQ